MPLLISHSRVNRSTALRLSEELHKRNVETWLDLRDATPGKERAPEVSAAIQRAEGFVSVIRPTRPIDRRQTFQWRRIVERESYLDPSKPLIPVLIGEPEMPGFLKTLRWDSCIRSSSRTWPASIRRRTSRRCRRQTGSCRVVDDSPDYAPPAPLPKKMRAAYPTMLKLLEEAKSDELGHLTWPMMLKSVERVISAL